MLRPRLTRSDDDEPEPSTLGGLDLSVALQTSDADPPLAGWIEPWVSRVAAAAGVSSGRLSVLVVGDAEMADLHRRYMDIHATTDVLTFDLRDDPGDPIDGDVVICLDEASRQAVARGHDARTEALLYVVHGLLHLLGEDDHDEGAYARMHRREDELLTAVGVGPVFARGDEL